MRLSELKNAGRTPELPMSLTLADAAGSAELQLLTLLRVLPGQRYVGAGVWRGRTVLAKLLVGDKAARHFQRELAGVRLLAEQGLTTPLLLADGLQDGEGGWLLFEFLEQASSLGDAWNAVQDLPPLADEQQAVLGEALSAIAQQHAKGLWQEDLHLDNLLRHQGRLYLIDGAGIRAEQAGKPLSRQKVLENLGVFFAQLPRSFEPFTEELLVHYLLSNAEHGLPMEALQKQIDKVRSWRLKDFMGKTVRDCSLFSVEDSASVFRAVRREEEPAMLPVLAQADALLGKGHLYKTGGAASVGRVEISGRTLVIKRYNIKNFSHWLKRFWRPSRAWHSWREGNRLMFLGIATPKPLAVQEKRFLGLRSKAWLVTEFIEGPDIIERFAPHVATGDAPEAELLALDTLFAQLIQARISHGDFKGHNLFWHTDRWAMIDLDAMQQHSSQSSFAAAYARDRARFMRNWPVQSALHQILEQRLPKITPD
ncbi:serine/threonine protein kinase [Pseudomonas amygdali pv. tabaci str. ATCC 11528]|uniref:Serine/threonine protein kinase n=5 Tax=Pseudomonas syringae group genomosp. 2 TaxID=251698 RepID=A0AAX1VMD0_PSEAJ|nr:MULTISPECIES: lipopolysaccharide kinase InaA family protein [Pseudomonas syringae group genomosp. 2]KEZ24543.1 serine/threonine protein kinase [Pseudomonas amygdali pv. tabaci str. 6605]KKY53738.1 serine/threonine protein kinase [Pseudomonas amygdali pv. tabaci str. ATCC 11528]KPX54128.1 Serine/threonine protein kinase [Pseudomonas amygdali pv. hibisci]QED82665.1 serine/threonine protein kinase [Pseudomonas amygdali pv. tabaci str. ATCC 11528]QOI02932.1 serine/threonine protein kinase [Pseu